MSEQQKPIKIEDLNQQIEKLREQTNTADAQITKFIEQRNELNDKVKQTRQEIDELKTERDSINEKVKLLKLRRDEIRAKTIPITEKINSIKEKIDELKKKVPRERQQDLQEELNAIEWKIQTTTLDLQEEKGLIENVKELETLLSAYKKIDAKYEKAKELMAQRQAIEAEADVIHNELTDLAKKSQEIHARMIEKVNNAKVSKAQADSLHQAYVKAKEDILGFQVKIAELTGQIRGLRAVMQEEDKARRLAAQQAYKERQLADKERQQADKEKQQVVKEKQQAIKEKLGAEARDKLQKGEKLSWNEFQLVMGDDEEGESKTQD
jgi:uncharacterized coiled-coil DUF342 family protein